MNGNSMFANEDSLSLQAEFAVACDNPKDFDFGFVEQRRETGFANFGFDPAVAAQLRGEVDEDDDLEDRDEFDDTDTDWDDEEFEDDDLEDDRFEESYGFDDDDSFPDEDNWE